MKSLVLALVAVSMTLAGCSAGSAQTDVAHSAATTASTTTLPVPATSTATTTGNTTMTNTTAPPPPPPAPPANHTRTRPPPANKTLGPFQYYSNTFHLSMSQTNVAGSGQNFGTNCLSITPQDFEDFSLLYGNYTATWAAQSPADAQLELTRGDLASGIYVRSGLRASALHDEWSGPGNLTNERGNSYVLALQLSGAGAMANQAATVELSFGYRSHDVPDVAMWSCSIG